MGSAPAIVPLPVSFHDLLASTTASGPSTRFAFLETRLQGRGTSFSASAKAR